MKISSSWILNTSKVTKRYYYFLFHCWSFFTYWLLKIIDPFTCILSLYICIDSHYNCPYHSFLQTEKTQLWFNYPLQVQLSKFLIMFGLVFFLNFVQFLLLVLSCCLPYWLKGCDWDLPLLEFSKCTLLDLHELLFMFWLLNQHNDRLIFSYVNLLTPLIAQTQGHECWHEKSTGKTWGLGKA